MQPVPNTAEREPVTLILTIWLPQAASFSNSSKANPCRSNVSAASWSKLLVFRLVSQTAQPVAPGFRYRPELTGVAFVLQVIEDLLDHHRIFDTRNDLDGATALTACLDINVENTLESLRPTHRRSPFAGCWLLIGQLSFVASAPLCWCHQRPVPTVRCKHTIVPATLSIITDMVGFATLATVDISFYKAYAYFGMFSMLTLILTTSTLIPLLMMTFPPASGGAVSDH
jgi:hypothetical protein